MAELGEGTSVGEDAEPWVESDTIVHMREGSEPVPADGGGGGLQIINGGLIHV